MLYIWMKTPLYSIRASLVIKDEKKGEAVSSTQKEFDFLDEQKIVDNEAEILKSESVLSRVVQKLSLDIGYYKKEGWLFYKPVFFISPIKVSYSGDVSRLKDPLDLTLIDDSTFRLDNTGVTYRFNEAFAWQACRFYITQTSHYTPSQSLRVKITAPADVVQNIKEDISILPPTKSSSILNLEMLHPSRYKGAQILNEIISEYSFANARDKQKQTDTILNLIDQRLDLVSNQLASFERREENYKVRNQITELSDNSKMYLEKARINDEGMKAVKKKIDLLSQVQDYVLTAGSVIAPPAMGDIEPLLISNVGQLNQLTLELKGLETTTGEASPLRSVKKAQVAELKANILNNIQLQKKALLGQLLNLEDEKRNIDSRLELVPSNERNLLQIIRERRIREDIYTYLLQKREEASIKDAAVFQAMRIIDKPYSSTLPVKPNKPLVLAAAFFVGLLVPIFGLNLKKTLTNHVTSIEQIGAKTDLENVAVLSNAPRQTLPLPATTPGVLSEQFRQLRTYLITHSQPREDGFIYLVSSTIPGEGKSFISINLALSFALLNKKTLLIDADLRSPRIYQHLGIPAQSGLETLLANSEEDPTEFIYRYGQQSNLDVLPSARAEELAGELLSRDLTPLFQALRKRYDHIIINTPPLGFFSDGLLLERYCDHCLLVIRYAFTKLAQLDYIRHIKNTGQLRKPVSIFNRVPFRETYGRLMVKKGQFRYYDSARVLE